MLPNSTLRCEAGVQRLDGFLQASGSAVASPTARAARCAPRPHPIAPPPAPARATRVGSPDAAALCGWARHSPTPRVANHCGRQLPPVTHLAAACTARRGARGPPASGAALRAPPARDVECMAWGYLASVWAAGSYPWPALAVVSKCQRSAWSHPAPLNTPLNTRCCCDEPAATPRAHPNFT